MLGGDEAIKGILAFEMVAADGGLATREWTINLAKGAEKNPLATIDIVDNKLRFRWHESAIDNRSSAAFANTVISFTSSGKVKNLILRKPILVPPLAVKLDKNSTKEKWRLAELPDHSIVHCVVTKISKGFPKTAYDPGKDITLARQFLKIRMGEKPETSNFYFSSDIQ